jgi:hypothetical protein
MEMKMGSNKEEDKTKWPLSTRILFLFLFQNLLTTKLWAKVKKKKKKKKVLEVAYAHMSRSPFTVGFNSL